MNKQVMAALAAGASTGALVSFLVTRKVVAKQYEDEYESVKEYYFDLGKEKALRDIRKEAEMEKAVESDENFKEFVDNSTTFLAEEGTVIDYSKLDILPEPEVEEDIEAAQAFEKIVEEYRSNGRYEIRGEEDFYTLQGFRQGHLWYDFDTDLVYTADGAPDVSKDYFDEMKNEEYAFDLWPLPPKGEEKRFTLVDNHERAKILVVIPAEFDPDDLVS